MEIQEEGKALVLAGYGIVASIIIIRRSRVNQRPTCTPRASVVVRPAGVRQRGWIFGNAEARMCARERIPIALKH
jgi:hypothetical protein